MSLCREMMPPWEMKAEMERLTADNERLRAALEEVRVLVFGANHSEARYPLARAALEGRT